MSSLKRKAGREMEILLSVNDRPWVFISLGKWLERCLLAFPKTNLADILLGCGLVEKGPKYPR